MKKIFKLLLLPVVAALVACGGGGGDPGTGTGTGTGTGVVNSQDTVLTMALQNSGGASVESIAAGGNSVLKATLTTKTGSPVAGQIVTIYKSAIDDLSVFPSGVKATTDQNGIASVLISRATLTRFGTVMIYAKFDGTTCDPSCDANTVQYGYASSDTLAVRADPPSLRLELRDTSGQPTTSIGATGFTTVQASLQFADGTPVVNKRVDISGDPAKVNFPEGGSQLTNAQGVASIKVTLAALTVNGADTLNGAATLVGTTPEGSDQTTVVSGLLDYQVGSANIALTDLDLGSGSLAAFGNRPIRVKASINGLPASNVPVNVTFNASCGVVSPAVVTTDATGTANTTYTASLATCAGTNVTISAAATGATPVSGPISVAASIATNVQFVSATPQLIYLQESVGTTQAQVSFKVVDSSGNPLQNKKLRLSLSNTSTGVSLDTVGNTGVVDLTTNSLGLVSAAVYSGTVPTSLNVRATLLDGNGSPTSVFSDSNLLTVASGRPVQQSLSLAFDKLSIEGFNHDGSEAYASLSMADRQGNPVPPGTQVNFVTESGVMLPAVCFVPPVTPATDSSPAIPVSVCTVKIRSQGTRTVNGRVSVLAYVDGEEDFVDVNGNNIFDAGDTFTGFDLGRAYRDDNAQAFAGANGVYDTGEFQVPRLSVPVCVAGTGCVGDGVWGKADVRKQATIVFATSQAVITGTASTTSLNFNVADVNGNSMPTGSDVEAEAISVSGQCGVAGKDTYATKIANTLYPSSFALPLTSCVSGNSILITITSPLGLETTGSILIP